MAERLVLFGDIETASSDERYNMDPQDFFRLGQWAYSRSGEVHTTTSYKDFRNRVEDADLVVFHNGISYDLPQIFGHESYIPLEMAANRRVLDTMVWAHLVYPAPNQFTTRNGHTFYDGSKPEKSLRWLSLDNLSHQLGLTGKIGDLKALAKKYGGFDQIPLDDPEFLEYAIQDIVALQELSVKLLDMGPVTDYVWREMLCVAIDAKISSNGWMVDQDKAQSRVDELKARRDKIMEWLVSDYDMPTDSKAPWKTNVGKGAIIKAFESFGIVPENNPTWPRTPANAPSFSGATMLAISEGTEAEDLGRSLAELQGQRSLAQLALDSTHADGKVHPDITSLQRTGRKSFTKPGLSVWTSRGEGAAEKEYLIAQPGHVLCEIDFSQIDARCVAALAADTEFAKRFEPGVDAHELSGRLAFGDEMYDSDPAKYRQIAKIGTHGWNYNIGVKKLAASLDIPQAQAKQFIDGLNAAYPRVAKWKARMSDQGESGWITNVHKRRMRVDVERSWSQSSGLVGQSSATELLKDALIRAYKHDPELIGMLKATIHDAVVLEFPDNRESELRELWKEILESTWKPEGGMEMTFPVSLGPKGARTWREAGH